MKIKVITHKSKTGYVTESPDYHEIVGYGKNKEQAKENFSEQFKQIYSKRIEE